MLTTHNLVELLKNHLLIANIAQKRQKVSKHLLDEINRQTQMMLALAEMAGENKEQLEAELVEEMNASNAILAAKRNNDPTAFSHSMEKYRQIYTRNCEKRGVELPTDYWDKWKLN